MNSTTPIIVFGSAGDLLVHQGPAKPAFFVPACNLHHVLTEDSPTPHIALTSHLPVTILHGSVRDIIDIKVLPNESIPSFGMNLRTSWRLGYTEPRTAAELRTFGERHQLHLVFTSDRSIFTPLGLGKLGTSNRHLAMDWERATQISPPAGFTINHPGWTAVRNLIREAILHHAPDLLGAVSHANDRN